MRGVHITGPGGGSVLGTDRAVIAAGPFLRRAGRLLGVEVPIFCELHAKIAWNDALRAMPRDPPLTIWADPMTIPWSPEERAEAAASGAHDLLLGSCPRARMAGPRARAPRHRPPGYLDLRHEPAEPTFPLAFDPAYPEVVLRGMARMIPALTPYLERLPRSFVDGGYYSKTRENRFLSGPLPVAGAYIIGALSGYGMMASNGAADLLADHIAERRSPTTRPPSASTATTTPRT